MRKKRNPANLHRRSTKTADQSLKDTVEAVVVAFILALTFRTYIVEAFQIPTGSMAPTLLGKHLRVACDQCGYAFRVDAGAAVGRETVSLDCAMCFNPVEVHIPPKTSLDVAGDRILVQKYLYRFAEPRRYDVAVFKNPENPETNFIKRLVGLPDETLMILDGNIYTQPGHHGPWRIARKTDPAVNPRWEKIQRDVFQPVYDSRYIPQDKGTSERRYGTTWRQPWEPQDQPLSADDTADNTADTENSDTDSADANQAPGWDITTDADHGAVFTYTPAAARIAGTLRFNPDPVGSYRLNYAQDFARYPYNEPDGSAAALRGWFEDLRLAVTVTPDPAAPPDAFSVSLAADARWNAGPETLTARFDADGTVSLQPAVGDRGRVLPPVSLPPFFKPGQPTTLEFWIVDQSFILWIDGKVALRHDLDLGRDQLLRRPPPISARDQRPTVTVTGGATLRRLQLDRDLVYNDARPDYPRRGAVERRTPYGFDLQDTHSVELSKDEFFAVGDNSPQSEDSRKWASVNPFVAERHFAGDGSPAVYGRVPRDLLMGRAFFVYFPAPRPIVTSGRNVVPNVAEMRFIH